MRFHFNSTKLQQTESVVRAVCGLTPEEIQIVEGASRGKTDTVKAEA